MSSEVYVALTLVPMVLAGIALVFAFLRYSKMGGDLKLLGISIAVSALIAGAVLYYLAAVSDTFASEVLFVFALVGAGA